MLKIRYLIIALLCTVAQGAWATDYNVGSETDLKDAITNGASITLTADITLSNYVDIPSSKTVTIDLNGHTLDRGLSELTSYGIVIRVENGGTLTVKDSGTGGTITGGYDATGGGICVLGTLNFESGTISGCTGTRGGAIYTTSDGTVTIYGGTVTATGGTYAAGIGGGEENSNGEIRIYGGTITATGGNRRWDNYGGGGAGIGGGEDGGMNNNIYIYGGTINANGGEDGAGIGGGGLDSYSGDMNSMN